jgi:hypothetical protein
MKKITMNFEEYQKEMANQFWAGMEHALDNVFKQVSDGEPVADVFDDELLELAERIDAEIHSAITSKK